MPVREEFSIIPHMDTPPKRSLCVTSLEIFSIKFGGMVYGLNCESMVCKGRCGES